MTIPQRVVWSEGMPVAPQHFQMHNCYTEQLLDVRLSALNPSPWGVGRLAIDEGALTAGELKIDALLAVLPNGMPIGVDAERGELIPSRPVADHFSADDRPLAVYVGVPREREGLENCSVETDARPRRTTYTRVERDVIDLTSGRRSVPVGFARRNAQILFDDEPREDFVCLKLAEITRDATITPAVSPSYIPPVLNVAVSPVLKDRLERLLRTVNARRNMLAALRRQRDASAIVFEGSDVTQYLFLWALSSHLPSLRALVADGGRFSPQAAFAVLGQLAGTLSSFAAGDDFEIPVPQLRHDEPGHAFSRMFDYLDRLLATLVQSRHISIPFTSTAPGMFHAKLEDPRLTRCRHFLLAVRSAADNDEISRLVKQSKLGSHTDVRNMRDYFISGAKLREVVRVPPEIPVQPSTLYFELNPQDDWLKRALRERDLVLSLRNPIERDKVSFEFLAVPRA